jgi:GR25 family glycosyltransferase involved in LPS biosynthesis
MQTILNSPAFVIHLKNKSHERANFFTKNILDAGFKNMIIFEAVDASNPTILEETMRQFPKIKFDKELSNGQIGCCLSHFKVLLHIIQNNIDFATIFEDDVHFHSNWSVLSERYYEHTPKNFDVIFIGNQINPKNPKISNSSTFCTHGYIVTLEGAKRLFKSLVTWDYQNFKYYQPGWDLDGLYNIDIMIKNIQDRTLTKQIKPLFTWYCWNGTYHPCEYNRLPLRGNNVRNTGLVFQCDNFESTIGINVHYFSDYFENNVDVIIKYKPNKKLFINWVKYDQENTDGYDVTECFIHYLSDSPNDSDYLIKQTEFKNKYNINPEFKHLKIHYNYIEP